MSEGKIAAADAEALEMHRRLIRRGVDLSIAFNTAVIGNGGVLVGAIVCRGCDAKAGRACATGCPHWFPRCVLPGERGMWYGGRLRRHLRGVPFGGTVWRTPRVG